MRFFLPILLLIACAPGGASSTDPGERPTGPTPEPEPPKPPVRTQEFAYTPPKVDLTFLIDAPIFVGDLLATVDVFISSLKGRDIDYHLGVANIDWHVDASGELELYEGIRWVDRSHPDPGTWLRAAMQQVWSRSPDECATLTAHEVLRRSATGGANAGFLREGSELAFLLFSDNYDMSNTKGVTQEDFLDLLFSVEPDLDRLGFHFIRWSWGDPWGEQHNFEIISEALPGYEWDAQTVPYFPLLVSIAHSIERHNVFTLDTIPNPATLQARVIQPDGDEVELPGSHLFYDPEANTVDFDTFFPDDGATVQVSYVPAEG